MWGVWVWALLSELFAMLAVVLFLFLFAIIVRPFFVGVFFFACFAFAPTSSSGGCCHRFIVFVQGSTQGGFCVFIVVAAVVVPHAGWYRGAHFFEHCCDRIGCAWGWGIFQSTDRVCFSQLLEDVS